MIDDLPDQPMQITTADQANARCVALEKQYGSNGVISKIGSELSRNSAEYIKIVNHPHFENFFAAHPTDRELFEAGLYEFVKKLGSSLLTLENVLNILTVMHLTWESNKDKRGTRIVSNFPQNQNFWLNCTSVENITLPGENSRRSVCVLQDTLNKVLNKELNRLIDLEKQQNTIPVLRDDTITLNNLVQRIPIPPAPVRAPNQTGNKAMSNENLVKTVAEAEARCTELDEQYKDKLFNTPYMKIIFENLKRNQTTCPEMVNELEAFLAAHKNDPNLGEKVGKGIEHLLRHLGSGLLTVENLRIILNLLDLTYQANEALANGQKLPVDFQENHFSLNKSDHEQKDGHQINVCADQTVLDDAFSAHLKLLRDSGKINNLDNTVTPQNLIQKFPLLKAPPAAPKPPPLQSNSNAKVEKGAFLVNPKIKDRKAQKVWWAEVQQKLTGNLQLGVSKNEKGKTVADCKELQVGNYRVFIKKQDKNGNQNVGYIPAGEVNEETIKVLATAMLAIHGKDPLIIPEPPTQKDADEFVAVYKALYEAKHGPMPKDHVEIKVPKEKLENKSQELTKIKGQTGKLEPYIVTLPENPTLQDLKVLAERTFQHVLKNPTEKVICQGGTLDTQQDFHGEYSALCFNYSQDYKSKNNNKAPPIVPPPLVRDENTARQGSGKRL